MVDMEIDHYVFSMNLEIDEQLSQFSEGLSKNCLFFSGDVSP